jgi:hypothetical protein
LEDAYEEYASLFTRRGLKDKKDLDIAKESFESEQVDVTIDSVSIEAKDSINLPLKLKAWISSPTYAQSNGDLIYINPHIIQRRRENPFKTKVRKFPIDYAYQRSYTAVINLTIPDNFEVKESPGNRSTSVGSEFAVYTRKVQVDSHQIRVTTKLNIRETAIKPDFYNELRSFYSQIVSAESEQLVLARIKKPVAPVPEVKAFKKKGKK